MSSISHISAIERYGDYRLAIQNLLGSILGGFADEKMFEGNEQEQKNALSKLHLHYPFVRMFYVLNSSGQQISANLVAKNRHVEARECVGVDRSRRPYYVMARDSDQVVVTEPYLSNSNRQLCISAALKYRDSRNHVLGYVVLDVDLFETLAFFMGDTRRSRFDPWFKAVYSIISAGLFAVVATLLITAFSELYGLFSHSDVVAEKSFRPFGAVIYLTLALAIFDLGKTTLEEEVLLHKDIFRHSSTRRTITRFMAAILIAISIESLLMIFKAALSDNPSNQLTGAVWILMAAVALLFSLGVYVYLGAKAEKTLVEVRNADR